MRISLILLALIPAVLGAVSDPVMQHDLVTARYHEPPEQFLQNRWTGFHGHKDPHPVLAKANVYPPIEPAWTGIQRLVFGTLDRVLAASNLNNSFFIGGARCYEIGTLRGAFLARGIIFGDEAGIWSQPYKMLDGILVEVRSPCGAWVPLNGSREVVNRLYCMEFTDSIDGLQALRRDFPAVDEWAFLHQLEFANPADTARELELRVTFQSNIRPIWHRPWFVEYGEDEVEPAGAGIFVARDRYIDGIETAFGVHAPGVDAEQSVEALNPYRPRGIVTLRLVIGPAATRRIDLGTVQWDRRKAEAAGRSGQYSGAASYLADLLPQADRLLAARQLSMRQAVFGQTAFACPDPDLQDAYYCALYNLASLQADTRPYLVRPHLMTCPERGYQLLFGIDPLYAAPGAAAAGFTSIIRSTLDAHFFYAAQSGNRSIHFLVDHFGRHFDRGSRAQETSQFIGTVWEFLKLTGDHAHAREIYPALRELYHGVELLDKDGDMWPEGMTFPSLTAEADTDTMLSAAVRLCWATRAMASLAAVLDDSAGLAYYRERLPVLLDRFDRDWWMESKDCWAIGLQPQSAGESRQVSLGRYTIRSLHYPQTYRIAAQERGVRALERMATEALDGQGGFPAPSVTVWQNSLMALGAFRYGLPEIGWPLIARAADNPLHLDKMLGGFSTLNPEPGEGPLNLNKIMYCWSAGPFVEAILYGLMGIEPDAFANRVRFNPQIPASWNHASVTGYRMGTHQLDFVLEEGSWTVFHQQGAGPVVVEASHDGRLVELAVGEAWSFPRAVRPVLRVSCGLDGYGRDN